MKAATIHEIKRELNVIDPAGISDLCIRLAKYKKENKELLSYLLFEAHDEPAYMESVKRDMDVQFAAINHANIYFAKKGLRRILRITGKHIRYTGSRQAEAELLLYFCSKLIHSPIPVRKNTALFNLYQFQVKKIAKVIATLHEDLQYDYLKELKNLL